MAEVQKRKIRPRNRGTDSTSKAQQITRNQKVNPKFKNQETDKSATNNSARADTGVNDLMLHKITHAPVSLYIVFLISSTRNT